MEFIKIEKKRYYQDFAGFKREAKFENADIDFKHCKFMEDVLEKKLSIMIKERKRMFGIREELFNESISESLSGKKRGVKE